MSTIKVYNMKSSSGKEVPNQFIISVGDGIQYFQSYRTIIAKTWIEYKENDNNIIRIALDKNAWDYSKTTTKYRNIFLGLGTKRIKQAIKDGTIELIDLN